MIKILLRIAGSVLLLAGALELWPLAAPPDQWGGPSAENAVRFAYSSPAQAESERLGAASGEGSLSSAAGESPSTMGGAAEIVPPGADSEAARWTPASRVRLSRIGLDSEVVESKFDRNNATWAIPA